MHLKQQIVNIFLQLTFAISEKQTLTAQLHITL